MNEHDSSDRRNDDGDRYDKPRGNREGRDRYRKSSGSYGDRDDRRGGYRKNYGDRDDRRGGYRKSWGDRDDRRGGYRKSYGDRDDRRGGYRKDFGDRDDRRGGYRKSYGDRDDRRGGYRKDFGDRDGRRGGYRKNFGDRDDRRGGYRKDHGDRDDRRGGYRRGSDRDDRRGGYRKDLGDRKDRQFRDRDQRDEAPINTKGDPELSEEITPDLLDPAMRKHLQTLSKENGDLVARHLVMAGALLNDDPQTAHEHALAAQRHGGRVGIVREALAMTSYAVGAYNLALREIHALRRLTGTNAHVVIEADCERGMGRPERALEVISEVDRDTLTDQFRVELALVESGARSDLGESEAGLLVVEDELTQSYDDDLKARLLSVKADRLEELERTEEAEAARAEALRLDPDVLGAEGPEGEAIDEEITLVEDE
ncbi:hypothetical protein BSZ39_02260 [Bowdeniella nasicola]|uniref:Uncharacterized protein n=1 Tax=Bowdeniella nasicola TaxID=208480 RepID=A0A1Q5Q4V8_9ACTO|nr:hypothetical protein [Bowdeniella nasicola]OKL54821.1 hypothetical protein BSZ39_02260 [Bowdeniella nasicola]